MPKILQTLSTAGAVLLSLSSFLFATPMTMNEQNTPRLREKHELRDVESGYPHHVLMKHESDKPQPKNPDAKPKVGKESTPLKPTKHH